MVTTSIGRTGHILARAMASGVAVIIGGVSLAQTTPQTVVAIMGRPAPGTSEAYRELSLPMLSNSGVIAFSSRLLNVPADYGEGLFAGPLDQPILLARTGDPIPGAGNNKIYGVATLLSVSDAGDVFISNSGMGSNPDPWIIGPAATSLARVVGGVGRPAPGLPGATLNGTAWGPHTASGSKTIFAAGYEPMDANQGFSGIWAGDLANPTLVARQHTRAPDLPDNYLYGALYNGSTEINPTGQVAYTANLVDAGNIQTPHGNALFSGLPSNPRLMMASGQRMPGPAEEYVSYVSSPRLTRSGKLAFLGHYGSQTDADGPSGGVFTADAGDPDSVRLIVASGQQVPGQPPGVIFRGGGGSGYIVEPFSSVQANAAGQVAFISSMGTIEDSLDQTENEAVWLYTPGKGLKMIAREKDPTPGIGGGYEFRAYIPPSVSHEPVVQALALNNRGQVVFVGSYAEEANGPFAFGLWGTDAAGNLGLIAVPGQSIDLGNGDVRQLSTVHYYGGTSSEDGQPFAFNDLGQLAYRATFMDGSQAIVVTTVPEPTTFLVRAAGVLWFLARRDRKWK